MPYDVSDEDVVVIHAWFAQALHDPVTAEDWAGYVGRFVGVPFSPHTTGFTAGLFYLPFMRLRRYSRDGQLFEILVSWIDLWLYFSLTRGMDLSLACQGPFVHNGHVMNLEEDF